MECREISKLTPVPTLPGSRCGAVRRTVPQSPATANGSAASRAAGEEIHRLILAGIGPGESVSAMDVSDPERLEQLRANIAERLRGVCAHMPVQEFDALVLRIASVTLRYEQKPRLSTPLANDSIDPNR